MNNLTIIGRFTRDPEYTDAVGDKSQYAKFTIAVDNEYGDNASFFDCIVFGRLADNVDKYMSKGRLVGIKGRHEQGDTYTDKNGNKRRSWTLRVEKIEFLDRPKEMEQKPEQNETGDSWEELENDIPFG